MLRSVPPFRADHVGSLLRPAALKEARARHASGEISGEQLRAIEDVCIKAVVAKQAAVGLQSATDGEFRRAMWHFDFLERLDGVESFHTDHGIAFQGGIETEAKGLRVTGKVGFSTHPSSTHPSSTHPSSTHPMLDHFRFLAQHTGATPKMTIPSPSVLHFRGGRKAVSQEIYPDMEEFYHDLALAYAGAVDAFADAGCHYLQLDETNLAYLCDAEQRKALAARGDDPDRLPEIYARMLNTAIRSRPDDMVVSMHLCRGNFRSSWSAGGLRTHRGAIVLRHRRERLLHGVRHRARRGI
jgi:5-methyltetrahydropteroyltriglutamate--homocysteine methyltransferase